MKSAIITFFKALSPRSAKFSWPAAFVGAWMVLLGRSAEASTFAEKTLVQKDQLRELIQVTVGPSDNFQGVLSPDGKRLYYTQSVQLAKHIYSMDVETGISKPVFDLAFDTRDPVISPDGSRLAFTTYRKDARGDVAVVEIGKEDEIRYLTQDDTEDHSPFWIDANRLGFISRSSVLKAQVTLTIFDFHENRREGIETGAIFDPVAMEQNGTTWIAAIRADGEKRWLALLDLSRRRWISIPILLPGFTSFPAWLKSGDHVYLYFGQYTLDTNQDQVVDAEDRSAVFRVNVTELLKMGKSSDAALPAEPITSLEYNCNYPHLAAGQVWITCSFRGSLDVYRLPQEGMLPQHWQEKEYRRALETARTYEERIFLLHALSVRLQSSKQRDEVLREFVSNTVLAGQFSAVHFYVDQWVRNKPEPYFSILDHLASAEQQQLVEPPGRLSASFIEFIRGKLKTVQRESATLPKGSQFGLLAESMLLTMIQERAKAKAILERIGIARIEDPIGLYYYARLIDALTPARKLSTLRFLSESTILDEETRTFYAYRFVSALNAATGVSVEKELAICKKETVLEAMLRLESPLQKLTADPHLAENAKLSGEIFNRVLSAKNRYFLQRAMYVRMILTMIKKGYWEFMYKFALTWLNYTPRNDLEYAFARRQFLGIALEMAYGQLAHNGFGFAGDDFYTALRLTDDFEAHHGYVISRVAQGRRGELDARYKDLLDGGFIKQNFPYVQALFLTSDAQKNREDFAKGGWLDHAIEEVETIPTGSYNPAPRYLLQGYLYYQKFKRAFREGRFDPVAFERAHHYTMLAYDLGRNNPRIEPKALFNLGLLHLVKHNYGEARSFFERRDWFPFMDDERQAFVWVYGKTLFATGDSEGALAVTAKWSDQNRGQGVFLERAAFYALQAGRWAEAVRRYEKYFAWLFNLPRSKAADFDTPVNRVRVNLGYGWALFREKNFSEARKHLEAVLEALHSNPANPANPVLFSKKIPGRHLANDKYRLLALGFLAQIESEPGKKMRLLEERDGLLRSIGDQLNDFAIRPEEWLQSLIQVRNQEARIDYAQKRLDSALGRLSSTLGNLDVLWTLTQNPLEPTLMPGLQNLMAVMIRSAQAKKPIAKNAVNRTNALVSAILEKLSIPATDLAEANLFDPRTSRFKAYTARFQSTCLPGNH